MYTLQTEQNIYVWSQVTSRIYKCFVSNRQYPICGATIAELDMQMAHLFCTVTEFLV